MTRRRLAGAIARLAPPEVGGRTSRGEAVRDSFVVVALALLSTAVYVADLGFYSDDWGFLMRLTAADDESLGELYRALVSGDPVIAQRPPQVVELVLLYSAFGLDPLGYHVVNAVVVAAGGVFFHLALRELRAPRELALAAPALYVVMPHFAAARFWVAAFQATLSMTLYFLSLYADLRSVRATFWRWRLIAVAALVVSALSYEVVLPLLAFNVLLIGAHVHRRPGRLPARRVAALVAVPNLAAIAAVVAYKAATTVRTGSDLSYLDHLVYVVSGSIRLNYGTYGVALPYVVGWILMNAAALAASLAAAAAGLLLAWYVVRASRGDASNDQSARLWLGWAAAGIVATVLGYATFVVETDIWFTSTSLGNRINVAAAAGVALTLASVVGVVTRSIGRGSPTAFAAGVGVLCAAFVLVTATLGSYWSDAKNRQQRAIDGLTAAITNPDRRTTIVLQGICVVRGGAYAFTGRRDLTGLLVIRYRDRSLRGTVVHTHPPRITPRGLRIRTFRRFELFPYGPRLVLFDARTGRVVPLTSPAVAARVVRLPDESTACRDQFAWQRGRLVP